MKCFLWNILCHFLFIDWVLTKVLESHSFACEKVFFCFSLLLFAIASLEWLGVPLLATIVFFLTINIDESFVFSLSLARSLAFRSSLRRWQCAWRRLCNVGSMSVSLASFSLIQLPIRDKRDTLRLKFKPKNSNAVFNPSSSSSFWWWINV